MALNACGVCHVEQARFAGSNYRFGTQYLWRLGNPDGLQTGAARPVRDLGLAGDQGERGPEVRGHQGGLTHGPGTAFHKPRSVNDAPHPAHVRFGS